MVGDSETETRGVTLTTEEWEEIDNLSELCPYAAHRAFYNSGVTAPVNDQYYRTFYLFKSSEKSINMWV